MQENIKHTVKYYKNIKKTIPHKNRNLEKLKLDSVQKGPHHL